MSAIIERDPVLISTGTATLAGLLTLPPDASNVILIANGIGRMQRPTGTGFAGAFHDAEMATLLFDMLTPDELQFDSRTGHFSNDSLFQAGRILDVVEWIRDTPPIEEFRIVAAASGPAARGLLRAAASDPGAFQALILDGGTRARDVPSGITVPAMLLVEDDPIQLKAARGVIDALAGEKRLEIVPASVQAEPFFGELSARIAVAWLGNVLR
ncbi:MAG TPA: hypothetical protein VKH35_03415 [Thermoanaerobaculia bacterium]|nr:hypothetical protein [Thermoanaerobaculia bacterium]